ncbi:hypothetical protein ACRRTK_013878 [Alexandromys fortis]
MVTLRPTLLSKWTSSLSQVSREKTSQVADVGERGSWSQGWGLGSRNFLECMG